MNQPTQIWTHHQKFTTPPSQILVKQQIILDDDIANHVQFDKERNLSYLPISISLTFKRKHHMYYMPTDFKKFTPGGLIVTGALKSSISQQDSNKIKQLAYETTKETDPPPNFQIPFVNGQRDVPIDTVLQEFEVADFMLRENFIIMKKLPNHPLVSAFSAETMSFLMSPKAS